MKTLVLCFALYFIFSSVHAREIAGVDLPETLQIPDAEPLLKLNGLGIRYKVFFKIYIAALYLQDKSSDVQTILTSNTPKRISMHFLYDEVPKEKLINGWNEGFEDNLTAEQYSALKPHIDQFNGYFETMKQGEVVDLDYLPGKGMRVMIKGQEKGIIEGDGFYQALLKIWLGDEPVGEELKEQLLGIEE